VKPRPAGGYTLTVPTAPADSPSSFPPLTPGELVMGCPYTFATMWANHPKSSDFADRSTLYPYLGWGNDRTIMTSRDWENTCAIRMSVGLIRCGTSLEVPPIGARVQATCPDARLRGKAVVLGFDRLANLLKTRWGAPTVYRNVSEADLNNKKGVIAYFVLPGSGYPGHIDLIRDTAPPTTRFFGLIRTDPTSFESGTGHYFGSREAWFWPSNG
jgi:hypothetical protein